MEFSKVLNGIVKYINKEMICNLNSWQELLARVSLSRIMANSSAIKTWLIENPFIKTFAVIDENGNVDIDGLMEDIKSVIREKGFVEIDIPIFGNFKFNENDINTLNSYIRGI